jgi:hypothetical protein
VSPNPLWVSGLTEDASAKWIGTNPNAAVSGNTALYAIPFTIPDAFTYAALTLHYAADNALAFEGVNGGIFLNGTAVCTNLIGVGMSSELTLTCDNVGSFLHVGTNWLYFNVVNLGSASGLLFSATITTAEAQPIALPHIAVGDEWTNGFFVVNDGAQDANFTIRFYGDAGNSVSLPFGGGVGSLAVLTDVVPAQGMKYYEASSPSMPVLGAWGLITADPSITVQGLFRRHSPNGSFYEAAVPSTVGSTEFVMPFDATTFAPTGGPLYTGFAIANLDPNTTANVVCVARDQSGVTIPNGVPTPPLNPLGHWANYLFPALTGKQGTIDCSANTLISAIGLRSIGTAAFSSLPVIRK